jgi:superoxide reductase
MQRRQFAARALAGAAIAVSLPVVAEAASARDKNVVFSADDPGHWAGVSALHVPDVTVSDGTLTVRTPHPMSAAHYIVSHSVVLADGAFLDRKTFASTDQPVSTHTLPAGYKGKVTITSTCNLHDFWVKTVTL